MYEYTFTPQALKQLKKLPKKIQKRIINKLDYFCKSEPLKFAQTLTDWRIGSYRFRIGNYRVIFDLEGKTIIILALGDRKEIYQ